MPTMALARPILDVTSKQLPALLAKYCFDELIDILSPTMCASMLITLLLA